LPDNVTLETFGWYDDEEVHGAACAEIIHEIAPEAQLFFAWYDGSDAAMGEGVDWLLGQGVDIISHSAGGLVGPRDGSEWDALLVDDLAAQGILWVNSAGNEGLGHYRGVFTDEDGDNLHEFAPGDEMLAIYNWGFVKVILSWDDDWEQAGRDYELYLYDADGNELAASQDAQAGELGHEPYEGILYETGGDTVYAVVEAYEVDLAVTLDIYVNGGDVAYPSPAHSICPPGDALGSLTVGAVNYWDDSLADYSSQGPTSDGRLKPEISAPAGVSGATYGSSGFDGTSASCPHTAGAAALVWQAHPEFSRQEVVDFLLANAIDLGPSGPDTGYGYGRLQLSAPPAIVPPTPLPGADTPAPPPDVTPAPLPSPTPVPYVTVTPAPPPPPPTGAGVGVGLLALTGIGLLIGGLGCAGAGLLLVGAVSLFVMGRRSRRAQPVTPPHIPTPPHVPTPPPAPPQLQPTRCQSCGAAIRPGARFCPICGQPAAPRVCRNCGAPLKEKARFCPKCGQPV
ncbi:MAG: S8 family serine peptidase, partial [Chloroflexota bacterium]|nr:S8 family serine peptidase [Chloroflexota bacterium]